MHESQEIFTITLITDGENSKLLLSTNEIPAKDDEEASGILYKEDLPKQFEEIVSKIPVFKAAMEEDGNEESVSHSVEEFLDLYDLDLIAVIEEGEEILSVDLDGNENKEGKESHIDGIFDGEDSDLGSSIEKDKTGSDPFAIYDRDYPTENEDSHIDPREAF